MTPVLTTGSINTVKELPSTYKKADDLYVDYDDNCSYVGLEGHPTEFNRDFYALAGRDHTEMEDWYTSPSSDWDDWFDEDLGVHSVTAPLANSGSSSIAHMSPT